jgi:uncharacterized protein YuzE
MKVTYDRSVDAAYIYLAENIGDGCVKKTYACDPEEVGGIINIDFDEDGRILGVEVLGASHHLPKKMLKEAVPL